MTTEQTGGTPPEESTPGTVRTAVLAFAVDVLCVVIFVAVGRRNHAEAVTVAGVAQTAGPFLAGLAISWLVSRAWRLPNAVVPTGLTVWVGTVSIGMAVRAGLGGGVAVSFVLVASLVTAALLLGWRGVAQLIRAKSAGQPSAGRR